MRMRAKPAAGGAALALETWAERRPTVINVIEGCAFVPKGFVPTFASAAK